MGSPGKEGGQGEVLQLRDASACQCEGEECPGPEGFQGEQKSKSGVLSYVEAEGAVGGEKNDQGGELCLLLANDGEAHTQPVIQVHDGVNTHLCTVLSDVTLVSEQLNIPYAI